ncbi:ABC transporter ATP-binding protein [Corynebacterium testudinoris]|uniref:Putative ABC transporter ATP-binding protein n=1 Tax=Corynebacterium testudinoris TaxID=136857 RepID=A0A0G3H790_9CORY|nr:ABC transporter ATP-binding protein [Corynebacterium testudinoris]AKK07693.1 putative ABC transporter ATP-binding protein [Corynebacterium testudinoris]MBX8995805.1 ABC transporter ATP-binding protein [Corynebacterium testudinoris]
MTLLQVSDLHVSYSTSQGPVYAAQGVSLSVEPGQVTAIVGESGSGKSTTAHAALGLLPGNAQIESGEITLAGRSLIGLSERQWRSIRGTRIGLVPQDPNNSLNPVKTIGASVAEGLRIHGRPVSDSRVIELLERVGIDDPARRARQYPHELSGGMKQRALIASAIALEPELIIADEPTSALDVTVQKTILDLLDDMRRDIGLGILFITHDLAVAGDRADQVVVMQRGQVKESGPAASLLTDPHDPYTQRLLANAPSLATGTATPRQRPPLSEDILLEVKNLRQEFGQGSNTFVAVEDMSFQVVRGSTHAIVGESGSGKTTTGRAIAAFTRPTAGTITIDGKEIQNATSKERRELRRVVQMVYQNPFSSLDPRQSVGASIAEPLKNFGSRSKATIDAAVAEHLDLVALDPALASRRPAELSGGQRQRVAIARALILQPELVVFDEAVSALDVTVQAQILELLDNLQRELHLTYVFISHDLAVVRQISDTVTVMKSGRHVEEGSTAEVFDHPQDDFTRTLLDAIPGRSYRAGALNLGL